MLNGYSPGFSAILGLATCIAVRRWANASVRMLSHRTPVTALKKSSSCFAENPETGEPTIKSEFPSGKQFLFIISRGDPEPPGLFPQFYDHLNEWLKLIPLSLGAGKYEFFHQYETGFDRKSAINDPEMLGKAKAFGAGFDVQVL